MRVWTRCLSAVAVLLAAGFLTACGSGGSSATNPGGNPTASNINALLFVMLSEGGGITDQTTNRYSRVQTDATGAPLDPQVTTWNPNVLYYRYVVSSTVANITVTPLAQDTTEPPSIRVSGGGLSNQVVATGTASPAIALTFGADLNPISIESIAADGRTTRTYVLRITRLPPTAAELGALQLSNGVDLDPAFDRVVTDYTANAPFTVSSLRVTPTAQDSNATLTYRVNDGAPVPISTGASSAEIPLSIPAPTLVTVRVTATDLLTIKEYQVSITRAGSGDLTALSFNIGALDPAFAPGTAQYTSAQNFFTSEVGIRPTAAEGSAALIQILHANGVQEVTSGFLSQPIPLCLPAANPCQTPVDIDVLSSNGTTNKTYTVTFIRDVAPPYQQSAYLKALTIGAGDGFGHAVAISGDTLAVGAPREHRFSPLLAGNGAVHVYVRGPGGAWSHQARIEGAGPGDEFGGSVALSSDGDTLVVGVPLKNIRGAVHVYTRSGTLWSEQARLDVAEGEDFDQFGFSVALSGETLAVGAPLEGGSGAVYIYERTGNTWSGPTRRVASDAPPTARFGASVSLDGDTLAVGANTKDLGHGAVYFYARAGGAWVEQAQQLQGTITGFAGFGYSVALDGDTLAVGAPAERGTLPDTANTGGAYVFTRDSGTGVWALVTRLVASNAGEGDGFGTSVALQGDRLIVGAPLEDSNGTGVNNNTAKTNNSAVNSGAVYVFEASAGDWEEVSYIKASNTGGQPSVGGNQGDLLGASVAIDGDTLVAGAWGEDSNGTPTDNSMIDSGAAYVFDPLP